nr:hypothetical protein [Tanacetum cinerariifolium]
MVIDIVVLNILSDALPITTNGVQLTMSNPQERVDSPWMMSKNWLVQKQTAFDSSNPLIVDSLLKTIWLSIHHHLTNEVLAIPGQTAIVNPHIYVSCIKQFWNTASVKRSDDVTRLQALVDRKKIVISKDVIREILQLDDAEGMVCLPNEEIFAGLAQMGYEKLAKRTSWNEFSSVMASAVICLSKGVETPLFEGMLAVREIAEEGIVEEQVQADDVVAAAVQETAAEDGVEFPTHLFQQVLDTCSALTRRVENLEHDKAAQKLEIITLKARVKRLERANKVKSFKLRRLKKVGTSQRIKSSNDIEDVFNQGRMIDDLDKDEGIELAEIYHLDLDHPSKVLSMQEDDSEVQKVVEVVTTAKLITEVVTTATSQDKGKGILIETLKPMKKKDQIELHAEYARKLHEEINKDHEEINKDIDWDAAIDHVKQKSKDNPQYIKRYQAMKKRPQTESEARKNMMIYLKNTAGYMLDFFKGMSYDEIRPIFQARFDANMRSYSTCKKAKVKKVNDEVRIQDLVDGKRVNIKESLIRRILRLDDTEGTSCLTNTEIFDGLAKMGYEKPCDKLTFYKAFFSPQWKFLIHTILLCRSAKSTSWNEFSSTMASAIICLATNQKLNFSRCILLSLVKNIKAGVPFFMFPRVGTRFSKEVTPLFNNMLVQALEEVGILQADAQPIPIPTEPSTSKPQKKHKPKRKHTKEPEVPLTESQVEHNVPLSSPSHDPLPSGEDSLKLKELMDLYTNLSNKVLDLKSKVIDIKSTYKANIEKLESRVERLEKENRVLKRLNDHQEKVLSILDVNDEEPTSVEEVLEVVKAAKLITKVVTTSKVDVNATSVQDTPITIVEATKMIDEVPKPRKRRCVIIQDPKEITTTTTIDTVKPKVMSYDEIRPLFEKHYNYNPAFLNEVNEGIKVLEKEVRQEKEVEVKSFKREGESLEQEIAKEQKMEQESEELKKCLQIVPDDDDMYTKATPLASKIPIIDYKIHTERNRPYFKIIRANGNHKLFMSFSTMLKNFERDDLESLWKIVREKFEKTEPKNYLDDYLLNTLKIMFEKPNVEANIFLLVEKMYPLTHFTLEQMVNDVRLEVDDKSEITLELLRLVRRELNEGGGLLGIIGLHKLVLLDQLSAAA